MSAAAIPVSPELAASVARWRANTGRAALADAFEAGEIETVPAAQRNRPDLPSQSNWRHMRRRRREQRSPDRQRSYERRHRRAWSGPLPGFMAGRMTISAMAVASVIADEHRRRRLCDLSIAEIAARAGVCRKTAKRALRLASALRLISIEERPVKGRKSLTNVIKIISREWLCWIEKRTPARYRPHTPLADADGHSERPIGGHLDTPTNTSLKRLGEKEDRGGEMVGGHQPFRGEWRPPPMRGLAS